MNELIDHGRKDIDTVVYGEFNGAVLFSDTVTMDSAYQEITGMNKAEYDKAYQEEIKKILGDDKSH